MRARISPRATLCTSTLIGSSHSDLLDSKAKIVRREMRVPFRHRDLAVTEQVLHGVEVDAGLDELRCEVVTAVVQAEVLELCRLYERFPTGVDALHTGTVM